MRSTAEFRPGAVAPALPEPPAGIVVGRRTFVAASALAVLVTGWAGYASWQLASGGEIGSAARWHSAELRYAYEDRIGQLSDRLEHSVTQSLVERTTFETRVAALVARQAEIEARQAWLRGVADRAATGGAGPFPLSRPPEAAAAKPQAKPAPVAEEPALRLRDGSGTDAPPPRDRLSALERAVERIGADEARILSALGNSARVRLARLRSAIDATGIDLDRASRTGRSAAVGGPLVEMPGGVQIGGLGALASEVRYGFAELDRLQQAASALPFGSPLPADAEQTSAFGYRTDPFTRTAALHTGIDFRSETGTLARATGAGTVVAAEYAGGYGLMVEVEHGAGVTTRYGHLSAVTVSVGERVDAGRVVGRTGSTGRSTGPHLHYETRLNGEPVDPTRFLDAGRRLGGGAG